MVARVWPRELVGQRTSRCAIGSVTGELMCVLRVVVRVVNAARPHCYQSIGDTFVQLFRVRASGVIASSQAVDLEVADKKMSDSPKQSASSAAMRPQGQ